MYGHLVYFWSFGRIFVIWFILSRFGMLYQEKSGNHWLDHYSQTSRYVQRMRNKYEFAFLKHRRNMFGKIFKKETNYVPLTKRKNMKRKKAS
jgi:hypothetical protein